jgi:hypothetical protein
LLAEATRLRSCGTAFSGGRDVVGVPDKPN